MENSQTKIDEVAVCIVTHNNYHQTKFFIDRLLGITDGYVKLYVYDYGSVDTGLHDYLKEVCKEHGGVFKSVKKPSGLAKFYNQIIKDVNEQYIAFLPIDFLLPEGWLPELLYHYKNIENSGCISLRNQFDDVALSSVLFKNVLKGEDEMRLVYFKNPNVTENMIFFDKSRLEKTGLLDEKFEHDGYVFNEFSFRFASNGYINYLIKNVSAAKIFIEDDILNPKKTKEGFEAFRKEVNEMIKKQKFKK